MGFSTLLAERNRLQGVAGVPTTSNTSQYDSFVNDAIEAIVAAHDWAFLRNAYSDAFNTEAPYSTGTIAVAAGATAVVGTGTLWSTNGLTLGATGTYEILIGTEVYGITLTTAQEGQGTLSRAIHKAFAAGTTYTIFKRVYGLSARMRSLQEAWVLASPRWPLKVVDWSEIAESLSLTPSFTAYPERIAFSNIDSSDTTRVILDCVPAAVQGVYYTGFQEVAALSDTGTAIPLPKKFKPCFHEFADYFMFKFRDDARMTASQNMAFGLLESLIKSDDPSQGTLDKGNLDRNFFRPVNRREAPSRSGNP